MQPRSGTVKIDIASRPGQCALARDADIRDAHEHVREGPILLKKSASRTKLGWPLRLPAFLGRLRARDWYQFGQLPEVLGSCCEEELVMGTIWSS
jgi:hypothetical protein